MLLAAFALTVHIACGSDAASNCPARCAALAQICPEIDAQTDCNHLCASKPSELLLSCLEASDCAVLVDAVQDHAGCGFKAATPDNPARCQGAAYDHIGFSSSNASCQCPLDIYNGGEHAGRVGDPCSDAGPCPWVCCGCFDGLVDGQTFLGAVCTNGRCAARRDTCAALSPTRCKGQISAQ